MPKLLFPVEQGTTPSRLEPKQLTELYKIGFGKFKTEEDVIKYHKYQLKDKLGEGGFGVVYMALDLEKNTKTACKKMDLGLDIKDPRVIDMKNELFIMEKVKHLYIVKLLRHFMTLSPKGNRIYLFMELADAGDLAKFCYKNGPFSEKDAKLYLAQIVCGINHMHSLGIAHRDIKLQNILLQKNNQSIIGEHILLVTDFGLSCIMHHNKQGDLFMNRTVCGTPMFMAPEILLKKPYNSFAVDIWALGISLFILISLQFPFDFRNEQEAIKNMMQKKWTFEDNKMKAKPSKELKSLMESMLEPNPKKRINIQQLIRHEWLAQSYNKAQNQANKNRKMIVQQCLNKK